MRPYFDVDFVDRGDAVVLVVVGEVDVSTVPVLEHGLSRAEVPNVRRVAKQDFSWDPGVDVTDVRQTKGLEFDEVVLLETTMASYPATPTARHALYVAATRASHQLWCVASQAPSELVTSAIRPADDADPAP